MNINNRRLIQFQWSNMNKKLPWHSESFPASPLESNGEQSIWHIIFGIIYVVTTNKAFDNTIIIKVHIIWTKTISDWWQVCWSLCFMCQRIHVHQHLSHQIKHVYHKPCIMLWLFLQSNQWYHEIYFTCHQRIKAR